MAIWRQLYGWVFPTACALCGAILGATPLDWWVLAPLPVFFAFFRVWRISGWLRPEACPGVGAILAASGMGLYYASWAFAHFVPRFL